MPFAVNRWQFNRLVFRNSFAGMYHYISATDVLLNYNVVNVRINISKIEYVVIVVSALRLRHSHNPAEGLDRKHGAVPLTKEHKYMRSRTIPAVCNGLLEYQNLGLIVIPRDIFRVLFIF